MSKNKKKKPNQKQSHMSSQAIILNQLMTSGEYQQQLALPDKAKEFMMSLPEERRKLDTSDPSRDSKEGRGRQAHRKPYHGVLPHPQHPSIPHRRDKQAGSTDSTSGSREYARQ